MPDFLYAVILLHRAYFKAYPPYELSVSEQENLTIRSEDRSSIQAGLQSLVKPEREGEVTGHQAWCVYYPNE